MLRLEERHLKENIIRQNSEHHVIAAGPKETSMECHCLVELPEGHWRLKGHKQIPQTEAMHTNQREGLRWEIRSSKASV